MYKIILSFFIALFSLNALATEKTHLISFNDFTVEFNSNEDEIEYQQSEFDSTIYATEHFSSKITKKLTVGIIDYKKRNSYFGKLLNSSCFKTYTIKNIDIPNKITEDQETVLVTGVNIYQPKKQEHLLVIFKANLDDKTIMFIAQEIRADKKLNHDGINKMIEVAKLDVIKTLSNIKISQQIEK